MSSQLPPANSPSGDPDSKPRVFTPPPEEHDVRWWTFYGLTHRFSWILFKLWTWFKLYHAENIPREGGAILAANHQSFLDPWLLGGAVPRPLCFLARESLFSVPVLSWAIRRLGAYPVDREKSSAREALRVCLKILDRGRLLVFFPEGTRSPDGKLQPLKRGLAFVAKRSGVPVVPTLILGTYEVWPRDRKLPGFGGVRVFYGEPIRFTEIDTTESFLERLQSSYHRLAREAGAEHMIRDGLGPGGDEESSPIRFQSLDGSSEASRPPSGDTSTEDSALLRERLGRSPSAS